LKVSQSISSFDQNPLKGGMPPIASAPMMNVMEVIFMCLWSPPIFLMSCSSLMACITLPEPRKRRPLKKACVMRWNTPAVYAPTPTAANMYPSWLTVE